MAEPGHDCEGAVIDPRDRANLNAKVREIVDLFAVRGVVTSMAATGAVVVSVPWDSEWCVQLARAGFSPGYTEATGAPVVACWLWFPTQKTLLPPRRFHVARATDTAGTRSVARVADGVLFSDGSVVLCWLGEFHSIAVYGSLRSAIKVHGHGGTTWFEFLDAAG